MKTIGVLILFLLCAAPVSAQKTFMLWPRHLDFESKCIDHVLDQFGESEDVYSGYTFRLKDPKAFAEAVKRGWKIHLYLNSSNWHERQWKKSWPVTEIKDRWCVRADPSKPYGPDNRVYYKNERVLFDVGVPSFQRWAAAWAVKLAEPYAGISFDNVLLGDARIKGLTADNPSWEYEGREDEWNIAMVRYLAVVQQALSANGKRLCVNTTLALDGDEHWWRALILGAKVDIVLTEKFPGKDKAASLKRIEWVMRRGTDAWVVFYDYNSFRDVRDIASIDDPRLRVSVFLDDDNGKRDASGVVKAIGAK